MTKKYNHLCSTKKIKPNPNKTWLNTSKSNRNNLNQNDQTHPAPDLGEMYPRLEQSSIQWKNRYFFLSFSRLFSFPPFRPRFSQYQAPLSAEDTKAVAFPLPHVNSALITTITIWWRVKAKIPVWPPPVKIRRRCGCRHALHSLSCFPFQVPFNPEGFRLMKCSWYQLTVRN